MIHLTAFESSWLSLVAALGATLAIPGLFRPDRNFHRALILFAAFALGIRYVVWRATETLAPFGWTVDCAVSWSFFALEAANFLSAFSVFLMMSRTRQRHAEADVNAAWWLPAPAPRVIVLVASYNEDADVLERTLAGCADLDYPNAEVWLLDDGRRPWLGEFCARFGARHVTRPDNAHAKAGNINHALALLAAEGAPNFVAVLDADFVPHSQFLARALALFHADDVGLVQTPQHFFNPDPVQHNLGLRRSYPDEQRFFFHQLMPARDAWDIAFCCGTSSMIRFAPLAEIGFFPTESVTEDFLLSQALKLHGFRTVYLDEPLTEGLAPEGVKEYITQRARWCLGQMQIVRGSYGPLSRRPLSWRDRWSVTDAFLNWTAAFSFRIATLTFPLLYWYFDIVVVNATVPDVISFFAPYLVYTLFAMNFLSGGLVVPLIPDVAQTLAAIPITRAAWTGLARPKGHPFKVTAKGGDRTRTVIQWRLMRPFLVLFALTAVGLVIGLVSWRFEFSNAGEGKVVTLFWTFYNLVVLALTMLVCVELPRSDRHVGDRPERTVVEAGGRRETVWLCGLTLTDARLRGFEAPRGTALSLAIADVGEVAGSVIACQPGNTIVRLEPDAAARLALLQRLHAAGGAPNVVRPRPWGMVGDLLIRIGTGRP